MTKIIDTIKPFVPAPVKSMIKRKSPQFYLYRRPTAVLRLMPDFLIIGAQKCGTTSLYSYLSEHPYVAPAFRKEIHFFDFYFRKGVNWYKSHFPSSLCKYYYQRRGQHLITGEASTHYISFPSVPRRVFELIPQVKLIALLRNPIDRACSHYYHSLRRGYETLSFEEAIDSEVERLRLENEKIPRDENASCLSHQWHSYLSKGIYVEQLKAWRNLFPKEQILIIKSEDFYVDPPTIFKQATAFLNLPEWELKRYETFLKGTYPKMEGNLRKRLADYFEPHNQRLYEYLGVNFNWK